MVSDSPWIVKLCGDAPEQLGTYRDRHSLVIALMRLREGKGLIQSPRTHQMPILVGNG